MVLRGTADYFDNHLPINHFHLPREFHRQTFWTIRTMKTIHLNLPINIITGVITEVITIFLHWCNRQNICPVVQERDTESSMTMESYWIWFIRNFLRLDLNHYHLPLNTSDWTVICSPELEYWILWLFLLSIWSIEVDSVRLIMTEKTWFVVSLVWSVSSQSIDNYVNYE